MRGRVRAAVAWIGATALAAVLCAVGFWIGGWAGTGVAAGVVAAILIPTRYIASPSRTMYMKLRVADGARVRIESATPAEMAVILRLLTHSGADLVRAHDDLMRSALDELVQPGRLLFNPPDRMQLGETQRVTRYGLPARSIWMQSFSSTFAGRGYRNWRRS